MLSKRAKGAIAFLRENWPNDGAGGGSVHLVCEELENAHQFISLVERELNAARDRECELTRQLAELRAVIDSPETNDFLEAVPREAAYQVERWGAEHDAGKEPEAWFWLLGWLAGKAVHAARAGDVEKAKHHTISSAAVLLNWHAQLSGSRSSFRPWIEPPAEVAIAGEGVLSGAREKDVDCG